MRITIEVTLDVDSLGQAERVAQERLGYDEDYGFPYHIVKWDVFEGYGATR
jgi:hypothetical protein